MKVHISCFLVVLALLLQSANSAPVIVNEYNAVSSSRTLAGGSADEVFGTVVENGGDWIELVVVGSGVGTTVDMRGWQVEIQRQVVSPFSADDTIVLSNDAYWMTVPAGTIVTITESRTAEGGMDTALNATDNRATEGWAHSNVWVGDSALITYTDELTNGYTLDPVLGVSGMNLNDSDTQIRILNEIGSVVFGPAGEGVMPIGDEIGKEETFLLQQTPSDIVTPTSNYGDGSDGVDGSAHSTFGRPNHWVAAGEVFEQPFTGFQTGGAVPVFLTSQKDSIIFTGNLFNYQIQSLDADGDALALTVLQGPGFLGLSDNGNGTGQLSGTPNSTEAGTYVVKLQVSDNADGVHVQAFVLTVLPLTSPVIVNEYNAVSSTKGLSEDWSFDQRFGRIRGNGDDWIELVVLGNGTAGSTVDMRGWRIEIFENGESAGTIALSSDAYWQAVQAGTILTFSESDTAGGGMDTSLLAENRYAIEGWAWSNIYLGDPSLIDHSYGNGAIGIVGDETKISILNNLGQVVAGAYGEGFFSSDPVSNEQVFRLAANPSPSTHPLTPQFSAAETSTFGHPNRLQESDGTVVGAPLGSGTGYQSFKAFATGAASAAPYFTNLWGTLDVNNTVPDTTWNGPSISAQDIDHAAITLSFSLVAPPSGMVLTDHGDGTADLVWTPVVSQIGVHSVAVKVTDPSGAFLIREFKVAVMPLSSPVLVNEYNSVSSSNFLNSGTMALDFDGGMAMDSFFGRIAGNGDDWIELVVVGDGTADSTVDLRGWQVVVSEYEAPIETIVLSQHSYLSAVRAGTIITLVDRDTIGGGLDSAIHRVNRFTDLGYAWTNIAVGDATFVDQSASTFGSSLSLGATETEITLKDAGGQVVSGPTGEPRILRNVSSDEVFHLERDPAPSINSSVAGVGFPNYADNIESSSFAEPNQWVADVGGVPISFTQDFSAYLSSASTNSLPTFTQLPTFFYGVAGSTHSQPVAASDFEGTASLTLSLINSPGWVSLVDLGNGAGTLAWTPPGGVSGFHDISLSVSDGLDSVVRTFQVFIHPASSPIVLNEYNAVTANSFINGGNVDSDSGGGTASDTRFGRVAGNGGDWFELVVVGDDGPGFVDMRGWKIEVAADASFPFEPDAVIELSNDLYWASVRHGTILTFTEVGTSAGGMDTSVGAEDHFATEGWGWSNFWIGDPQFFTYVDAATNGYLLDPARDEISNFNISSNRNQFVVRDAGGNIVYGPAGEGISTGIDVTSQSVWELVENPRSTVTPHDFAALGLDGSTFGEPNQSNSGSTIQDFSIFIEPYDVYVATAGLLGADALFGADPDKDGATNGLEFALGSNPNDGGSIPYYLINADTGSLTFLRRVGGTSMSDLYSVDSLVMEVQYSTDLAIWTVTGLEGSVPVGLPTPPVGYEHANYLLPGGVTAGSDRIFMRVSITSP